MRHGDYASAWLASDRIRARTMRFGDPALPRHLQTIWNGDSLDGRRVLVRCYHGLGDTIQFARYLPVLSARAKSVALWAQPALLPLLRTLAGRVTLLPLHDGAPDVDYDVDIEIMELPWAFRTTLTTIPADVPYLHATPSGPLAGAPLAVGVVWRSGEWNHTRSIDFELLRSLFEVSDVNWYSLQLAPRCREHHGRLRVLDLASIEMTAGHIRALDLVISVDSMPAHLAGALGAPVWTLLSHEPDWRWMNDRADSPWYPTMRLFRSERPDWHDLIDALDAALREFVHSRLVNRR